MAALVAGVVLGSFGIAGAGNVTPAALPAQTDCGTECAPADAAACGVSDCAVPEAGAVMDCGTGACPEPGVAAGQASGGACADCQ